MPDDIIHPDLFSAFADPAADMAHRDADAFEVLHRDNETEAPQHFPEKSPAEALAAIYARNLDLAAEGIDIEAVAPDAALRHARNDQADFTLLGEAEKAEAALVIADNFRNRTYSAEFARNDPDAAQYVVRELARQDQVASEFSGLSDAQLDKALTPEVASTQAHRASTPATEKREILNELREHDRTANPGYSPLESWRNLRLVARTNSLTASIQRSAGEDGPPYVIRYAEADGRATSIQSELHQDGKAVTTVAGERVPGTGFTSDTVWQREAFNRAVNRYRLDEIQKETEQIHATPAFRAMETKREDEFRQAQTLLDNNAGEALKIRLIQDSKGQHNVALQNGEETRTFFSNSSIHAANQVLKNLRQDMGNKVFSMADFLVLPKLIARKSKNSGRPIFEQETPPVNQIRDDAPARLEKDGRLAVNHEFDGKRVLKAHELPQHFHKRFIVSDEVPGKFYFPDSKKLAFADHGGKLATDENRPEVIRSMIELAKEKNWSSITVSGSDEFKREAWLQASLEGMEVKGYKPKPEDIALLDQAREQQMTNRLYQAPGDRQPIPAPPQNEINANLQPSASGKEPAQPHIQSQRITLSIPNGSQVDPELLKVIETAITRPAAPHTEAGTQGFKVPDSYKPSPDALAVAETMRADGVPEDKMRLVMYGVDLSKQSAQEKGIPEFQARIFDPSVAPQKAVSIAVEKPAATQPAQDIAQPTPSPRR